MTVLQEELPNVSNKPLLLPLLLLFALFELIHRLNLERLNLEWDFYPNGLNPKWD